MLTKNDLSQIRVVVHEEVDVVVEKKIKPIKKDLGYLRKTLDLTVKNFDEGDIKLEKRVRKIEEHFSLTP